VKIAVVFGTRPEAIKLAPVILALRREPEFNCWTCTTGQHRELLDQALAVFGIKPDLDLQLMRADQSLGALTARVIEALDACLAREKPNLVLVQGDTTTVFCATLAAFYHQIPVGHVEAGLRTGNLKSPWPEEANRVMTSRLATLHFAPTQVSRDHLLHEGVPCASIFVTGNTVVDALLLALEKVRVQPPEIPGLPAEVLSGNDTRLVLITGHRRENFGAGFESICQSIARLGRRFPHTHFVYPVHLNPNVREPVLRILGPAAATANIHLLEPLDYLPFVALMNRATLILTDSGGVQEEAPSLRKPVLVTRDTTERPEAVAARAVKLVGTDALAIFEEASRLLEDPLAYEQMRPTHNPYGDGRAAQRIVGICHDYLQRRS